MVLPVRRAARREGRNWAIQALCSQLTVGGRGLSGILAEEHSFKGQTLLPVELDYVGQTEHAVRAVLNASAALQAVNRWRRG